MAMREESKGADVKLRTGSVVHWRECKGGRVPVTCGRCHRRRLVVAHDFARRYTGYCRGCGKFKHLKDERLPSGVTVEWSRRDGQFVPVTCSKCGDTRLVKTKHIDQNFKGRCSNCWNEKPAADVTLPTGSIIHWSQRAEERVPVTCGRCGLRRTLAYADIDEGFTGFCKSCGKRKHVADVTLPSGSVIHYSQSTKDGVPVTCGGCGQRRTVKGISRRLDQYNGYCSDCRSKQHFEDEVLSSGSTVHWSERNAEGIPITCGKCGQRRTVRHLTGSSTGYCQSCATGERTGDELHPSGTVIHWSERDPENQRVKITCYRCLRERWFSVSNTANDRWSGGCEVCRRETASGRKRTGDQILASGSTVHWSERNPDHYQQVMVTCGFVDREGNVCGEKRYTEPPHAKKALAKWTGYHRRHFQFVNVLDPAFAQNGNGQNSGDGKHVGAPYAFTDAEAWQAIQTLSSVNVSKLAKALGRPRSSVRNWVKRKGYSSLDKLVESETEGGGKNSS